MLNNCDLTWEQHKHSKLWPCWHELKRPSTGELLARVVRGVSNGSYSWTVYSKLGHGWGMEDTFEEAVAQVELAVMRYNLVVD